MRLRSDRWLLPLLVVACLVQVLLVQRPENIKNDASIYMGLAEALARGDGYVFNGQPHTVYPPGFAALLAGLSFVVGEGYPAFVRLMPVFGALALLAFLLLLRRVQGRGLALAAVLLTLTTPSFFESVTRRVGSDIPFMAAAAAALWLARRADERPDRLCSGRALALAACVAGALLLRSAGLSLVAGLALACLARVLLPGSSRSPRPLLAALLLGLLTQAAWMTWAAAAERPAWSGQFMETSYVDQLLVADPHQPELGRADLATLLERLGVMALLQAGHVAEMVLRVPWVDPRPTNGLLVLPLVLLLLGWVRSLRREADRPLPWFCAAYAGMYLLWPFDEDQRFLLPVLPLLVLFMGRGLGWLLDDLEQRPRPTLRSLLILTAVLLALSLLSRDSASSGQARMEPVLWSLCLAGLGLLAWRPSLAGSCAQGLRWSLPLATAILCLAGLVLQLGPARHNLSADPTSHRHHPSVSAFRWMAEQLPDSARVMASQTAIGFRLTGRPVVPTPITRDPDLIGGTLERSGSTHWLVLDDMPDAYFDPTEAERLELFVAARPEALRLLQQGPGYRLFERAAATGPGETDAPPPR